MWKKQSKDSTKIYMNLQKLVYVLHENANDSIEYPDICIILLHE